MATYPLAKQGVFLTVQGEGVLLGAPMVFVRLAGCSVGCPECDTDYRVHERVGAAEIARRASAFTQTDWVWVTGGEPTDHDLLPLFAELRRAGFRIALATAGARDLPGGVVQGGPDFVSVSPHTFSEKWLKRRGDQLNLVPGLNGLRLADLDEATIAQCVDGFPHRFVTPLWYTPADRVERVGECVEWVQRHPGFRLGIQAHKLWGLA